jgi:hypothetical protein
VCVVAASPVHATIMQDLEVIPFPKSNHAGSHKRSKQNTQRGARVTCWSQPKCSLRGWSAGQTETLPSCRTGSWRNQPKSLVRSSAACLSATSAAGSRAEATPVPFQRRELWVIQLGAREGPKPACLGVRGVYPRSEPATPPEGLIGGGRSGGSSGPQCTVADPSNITFNGYDKM